MKPNWSTAPSWAKWLAQSECGDWCWYEQKPSALGNGWDFDGKAEWASDGKGWFETIEPRPTNDGGEG